jgi:O-acetyl-ADP-ribose deacetylase (regulator of RNase III)
MIEHRVGDMLTGATSGFLVHGCNCQGKMGSGIAKLIRDKWPVVFETYHNIWEEGYWDDYNGVQQTHQLELGSTQFVYVNGGPGVDLFGQEDSLPRNPLVVVNAMTQRYYAGHPDDPNAERYVDYEAVVRCFTEINRVGAENQAVESVLHFPLIGAGLARGNWKIIETIIDETVTDMHKVLWTLE